MLEIREVALPQPGADEVLIKVYAASVNPLDGYLIKGPLFFLPAIGKRLNPKHRIAGADVSGQVQLVGSAVQRFQPGESVFGGSFSSRGAGGFAEYVCVIADCLTHKPDNISFEAAAAFPVAAITALQALRDHGRINQDRQF